MKCSVPDCRNYQKMVNKAHGITYHTFPRNLVMRTLWSKALGLGEMQPKTRHGVCSQHFQKDSFYVNKAGLLRLKSDAVPRIKLGKDMISPASTFRSPNQNCIKPTVELVCRICLCNDRKTYNLGKCDLLKYYELLTASLVSKDDELPKQVCWECKARLSSFARLRSVARHSLTLLSDFYSTVKSDPEASNKSLDTDRDLKEITSTLTKHIFECDHADYYFLNEEFTTLVDVLDIKNENNTNAGPSEPDIKIEVVNMDSVFNDDQNVHDTILDDINHQSVFDTKFDGEIDYQNVDDKKCDGEIDHQNVDDTEFDEQYVHDKKINCENGHQSVDDTKFDTIDVDDIKFDDENDNQNVDDTKFDNDNVDHDFEDMENDIMKIDNEIIDSEFNDSDDFGSSDEDLAIYMKNLKDKLINKKKVQTKPKKKEIVRRGVKPDWEELYEVKVLSVEERMLSVQNRKESSNYIKSEFKCEFCFRGFAVEGTFQRHLIKHSEEFGKFQCDYCKIRFKLKTAMMSHKRALHSKHYSCKQCDYVSQSPDTAILHERYHKGKRYKCPHCEMEFIKLTTYMSHIRIKHSSDFVCKLCGCSFVSAKGLTQHLIFKHHEDQREIPESGPCCVDCNIQFINEEALNTHYQKSTKHNENGVAPREGPKKVYEKRVKKAGTKVIEPGSTKLKTPINCEQCDMQLSDFKMYGYHFRTYHPEKSRTLYPDNKVKCLCDICGKSFPCLTHLYEHNLTHKGDKQFSCTQCGKSFLNSMRLKLHEKIHLKRRYSCEVCFKKFSTRGNVTKHMVIHRGMKFECEFCGKCFNHSENKKNHIDFVHLKKPWPKKNRAVRNKRKIKEPVQTELSNIDENSTPFVEDTTTSV